jgi:hypothetical protein
MERMAISVLGYLKSVAAVRCVQTNRKKIDMEEALKLLAVRMGRLHEPLAWQDDVEKRINKLRCGQW